MEPRVASDTRANIPLSPADGFEFEEVEEFRQSEEVADLIARVPQDDPLMTLFGVPLYQHQSTESRGIHAAGRAKIDDEAPLALRQLFEETNTLAPEVRPGFEAETFGGAEDPFV